MKLKTSLPTGRLVIFVVLSGWVMFLSYFIFESMEFGGDLLNHFFSTNNINRLVFHIVILSLPFGASITGYLMHERNNLFNRTKQSAEKLEQALKEWKITFDAMPYGVMLIDTEFNIIRANKYIADFYGFPIRELIFKKCHEVLHKLDPPPDNCPALKSVSTRRTETLEYYDRDRGKYFMTSVVPVFDDKGKIIAYSHPLIDITDIKQKEKKLSQSKKAFFNMLKDIDSSHKELQGLNNDLIIAFANAIDAKSPWTKGHSERVTIHAVSIAKEMGVSKKDIEVLKTAGLLHDIGKIGTYDEILDKPDNLTDKEFELVKKHPAKGAEILDPIKGMKNILPVIRAHHEKIDGTGYPDGLKGDEVPLTARILCVADSFDSMVSDRPYRPAPGKDYAIEELKRCSGTHFDSNVINAFIKVLENSREIVVNRNHSKQLSG